MALCRPTLQRLLNHGVNTNPCQLPEPTLMRSHTASSEIVCGTRRHVIEESPASLAFRKSKRLELLLGECEFLVRSDKTYILSPIPPGQHGSPKPQSRTCTDRTCRRGQPIELPGCVEAFPPGRSAHARKVGDDALISRANDR
eukprot:scaffold1183_cov418-Prasinococcus_capsulatus_cf.AAC.19